MGTPVQTALTEAARIRANPARIGIVNYGMGNLRSLVNAFGFLGYPTIVTEEGRKLADVDAVVLPGVGAFGEAMRSLVRLKLVDPIERAVIGNGRPFLGICLGMQLVAQSSAERGRYDGLGWIDAHVELVPESDDARVPHVGWNDVMQRRSSALFNNISPGANFFFDHSYRVLCDEELIDATCDYGPEQIVAALCRSNVYATQFHPEKSQRNGLRLLRNFLNLTESSRAC